MYMPVPAMIQAMIAPSGPVAPAKVLGSEKIPAPTMLPTTIAVSATRVTLPSVAVMVVPLPAVVAAKLACCWESGMDAICDCTMSARRILGINQVGRTTNEYFHHPENTWGRLSAAPGVDLIGVPTGIRTPVATVKG